VKEKDVLSYLTPPKITSEQKAIFYIPFKALWKLCSGKVVLHP